MTTCSRPRKNYVVNILNFGHKLIKLWYSRASLYMGSLSTDFSDTLFLRLVTDKFDVHRYVCRYLQIHSFWCPYIITRDTLFSKYSKTSRYTASTYGFHRYTVFNWVQENSSYTDFFIIFHRYTVFWIWKNENGTI